MNVQLHLVKALLTGKVKRKGMYIRLVSLSFIFSYDCIKALIGSNRTSITNQRALMQSSNQETESGSDPNSN